MPTPKKRQHRYNPTSEHFKKEDYPFYWLARLNGRYTMAMEKALKKIDMDIPRYRILFILLDNGESSISEISTHAIAKLSTITKIVYRMKADDLVDTRASEIDGRVTQVSLTEPGRRMIEKVQAATSGIIRESFNGLTDAQLSKLNSTLERIFNNLPED
ncbi:MarR family winged helix-turn-helix transcriptional regulator [Pseudomonas sp. R5(2019)]|uniref:MarR family winged helix-turn-helix transcriptional regulator n=1 Tax=Pseudomonas sp. R5(2019) TaxID=2697566 RepID=UPI0014133B3C|nr:winged helix DNA-binding protein [Pseudomonas sp. R5(2019)]NBA93362.1 winged helix DNA-binding protein [Pseudomonas sp. R5(2019)]